MIQSRSPAVPIVSTGRLESRPESRPDGRSERWPAGRRLRSVIAVINAPMRNPSPAVTINNSDSDKFHCVHNTLIAVGVLFCRASAIARAMRLIQAIQRKVCILFARWTEPGYCTGVLLFLLANRVRAVSAPPSIAGVCQSNRFGVDA